MEVILNDRLILIKEETNLLELLAENGIESFKGIAVAVNNKVIPKNDMAVFRLKNNDKIMIIKAVCGG